MNKEESRIVPQLRFPEFEDDGNWQETTLNDVFNIYAGGDKPSNVSNIKTKEFYIPILSNGINNKALYGWTDEPKIEIPSLTISARGTIGWTSFQDKPFYPIVRLIVLSPRADLNLKYAYYFMKTIENNYKIPPAGIPQLTKPMIKDVKILIPVSLNEQQRIAACLSSLDDVITAETEKLDLLQDHKKGLLQQLFPAEGETQPKFRFPEFKDDGDWVDTTLGKCLDYLQPTPYLVSSTDYDDKYETPVLTAGKTFILGYTDEQEGIFKENLPVIIFDDFTTASKFVDFPFKAKSSAMKILLAKGANDIKFMFEAIQNIKFEVKTHQRHWISVYANLEILKPKDPKEQQKIAACLSSLDELIDAQHQKIEDLKAHKKGLLQQLFPNINDLAV